MKNHRPTAVGGRQGRMFIRSISCPFWTPGGSRRGLSRGLQAAAPPCASAMSVCVLCPLLPEDTSPVGFRPPQDPTAL